MCLKLAEVWFIQVKWDGFRFMITTDKRSDIFKKIDEKYSSIYRKLVILVKRLSTLTGFCPVSCCYHKPCQRVRTYVDACAMHCCLSWIVSEIRNRVVFFSAGKYGMSDGVEKPCLVYTTFSNRIYLYHSVILPSIASSNLLTKMEEKVWFTYVCVEVSDSGFHFLLPKWGQKIWRATLQVDSQSSTNFQCIQGNHSMHF